jgi:hypothetical protein
VSHRFLEGSREDERDERRGRPRIRGDGSHPTGVERGERRRCDQESLRLDEGRDRYESSRDARASLAGHDEAQDRERRVGSVQKSEDRTRKPREGKRPVEGSEGQGAARAGAKQKKKEENREHVAQDRGELHGDVFRLGAIEVGSEKSDRHPRPPPEGHRERGVVDDEVAPLVLDLEELLAAER